MTKDKTLITGKTKLLGVIGYPIEHSLSPVMHNAAIAQLGIDYVYLPFPIKPEDLHTAIQGFAAIGVVGFSVTIPHKQAILRSLSAVEPIAQAVGAVNTVIKKNNSWIGTNTDIEGFLAPLQAHQQNWSQKIAVILGNGGAARAVVAGCAKLGCAEIHVVGRNVQRLRDFSQSWENSPLQVNLNVHRWDELPELIPQADLLVNTTPIGMYPKIDESPLSAAEMANLSSQAIAYDLIYTPNPTKFLQQAQQIGVTAIDGLEMLVQQGAAALKIWLQRESVPVDVMRQALQKHLGL
ncbi:shikimate dehydrogenase [Fischerella thermalis WC542]|nr:shikimate dehydrogenase [Fischerella thermalis WC119]PLZ13548.1 shikimate dehydrogenase [Fischerella thermalis WC1110]PLZ15468.1 shikimate dehydrogenase [Fischerella thermalis WC114]PLZ20656.1 shikimate dehydrogenase [Fischerella thermalis WC157]PLZ23134.1 shikimate dehydrogenase [Fischerella thermalis WC341]PLZ30212.1 shikimate dehydrogenase [Fischerella thermalis WC559]PLZ33648.1 shikimate dehydrogenase [Fischerella thermalis WC558]PLZ37251.1 shikimate dehydrogenase [Fischerella thermal